MAVSKVISDAALFVSTMRLPESLRAPLAWYAARCSSPDLGPYYVAAGCLAAILAVYLVHLANRPTLRVVPLPPNDGRRNRRPQMTKLPPPYPNAWYRVMSSNELKAAEVKPVTVAGKNLVAYRGEDGAVRVCDAYCPHIGADLSGGHVEDNCIVCPFHGWTFSGEDGHVTKIPYSDKPPKFAALKTWQVREVNFQILVWYDAEGREPQYEPKVFEKIGNGSMKYVGRHEHHIAAHIQELPENGPDVAHLNVLHGPSMIKVLSPVMRHDWTAQWVPGTTEEDQHIVYMNVTHNLTILGKVISKNLAVIHQVGPTLVTLDINVLGLGRLLIMQSVCSLGPLHQKMVHAGHVSPWLPTWFGKILLWIMVSQFERDVPIWNQKLFLDKPILVKEEPEMVQYRRWFQKFYSENSVSAVDAMRSEGSLEW